VNTCRPEPKPHYPRPNTPDERLSHRDIALLNELHDLLLAVDRLTKVVDLRVGLTANSVSALVEQGEYR
jgi:hypothetical protein